MKLLGVAASNRRDGNSYLLLKEILGGELAVEAKIIQVAELRISPCEYCWESCSKTPFECVIEDDFEMLLEEMRSAHGIIIACPFYFYIPSRFKGFMERLFCIDHYTKARHLKGLDFLLGRKPCAFIVHSSTAGYDTLQVLNELQAFALTFQMQPITTDFWPYLGVSAKGGDERGVILKDKKAVERSRILVKSLTDRMLLSHKARARLPSGRC